MVPDKKVYSRAIAKWHHIGNIIGGNSQTPCWDQNIFVIIEGDQCLSASPIPRDIMSAPLFFPRVTALLECQANISDVRNENLQMFKQI